MNGKIETSEEFDDFLTSLDQNFFHVMPTDIDDETGAPLEDMILLKALMGNPEVLKIKNLAWFVDHFKWVD